MDDGFIEISGRVRIPEREIDWDFAHSGGPGGQNVNKVSSQARLRFDIDASEALGPEEKRRIRAALGNRITADGVLQIAASESRSQLSNRRIAKERFRELLA
ncbi:MAG: alternative ribosome rescue aminoacyl-tRNA hydrolase ArfB, partial [Planctomycetota bacterium]